LKLLIKNLRQPDFAPFGEILEFSLAEAGFQVKVSEQSSSGWRIALLRTENKSIRDIKCHPDSRESFEPIQGIAVLVVASHDSPNELEAFLLDKPVCLKKGIWHNSLALSEFATIKITENAEVGSQPYNLNCELSVVLA
jgi:ureidoglycolate hydrolase